MCAADMGTACQGPHSLRPMKNGKAFLGGGYLNVDDTDSACRYLQHEDYFPSETAPPEVS